jgi:hypothetical protein
MARLGQEAGPDAAETFRQCQDAGGPIATGAAVDLVRRTSRLAAWVQGLK